MFKRAASKNGCRHTGLLFNHFPSFNREASCLSRECAIAEFFASQAGDSSDKVLNGFYAPTGAKVNRPNLIINGLKVRSKLIRYKSAAFCSDCYQEGHEIFLKDLSIATACPIHKKKYITTCPHCKKKLGWFEPLFQQCNCDHLLESESCSASYVEPEQFLMTLWSRQNQNELDKLFKLLKSFGFNFGTPTSSYNRGVLRAAISIIQHRWEDLSLYIRQLLDYHIGISPDLIKAKLACIEGLDDTTIDRIYLLGCKIPSKLVTDKIDFLLSPAQIMRHFGITQHQFTHLQKNPEFPKKPSRQKWYCPSDIEAIKNIFSRAVLTKWGRLPTNKEATISANEAAASLNISRHQLNLIIKNKLLDSHIGQNRATMIKIENLETFKATFTFIKPLASQMGIQVSQVRDLLRKHYPTAPTFGMHALDLLITYTFRATTIKNEAILKQGFNRHRDDALASWAIRKSKIPRIDAETASNYTATSSAASRLGITRVTIYDLIKNKIFSDVCTSPTGGFLIPTDQIDKFWETYISLSDTAALLNCSKCSASSALLLDDIIPTTGPFINNGKTHLYIRSEIIRHLKKKKQSEASQKNNKWASLDEAAIYLKISQASLRNILRLEIFRDKVQYVHGRAYISQPFLIDFKKTYILSAEASEILKTPFIEVTKTLQKIGVLPITGSNIDGRSSHVFFRSDLTGDPIQAIQNIHTAENADINMTPQPTRYINIKDLLNKYKLSHISFTNTFVKYGFIKVRKFSQGTFLTTAAAESVSSILENYLTFAQADAIFEHHGHTRNLIKQGKLSPDQPIPPHLSKANFISKAKITKAIASFQQPPNSP